MMIMMFKQVDRILMNFNKVAMNNFAVNQNTQTDFLSTDQIDRSIDLSNLNKQARNNLNKFEFDEFEYNSTDTRHTPKKIE